MIKVFTCLTSIFILSFSAYSQTANVSGSVIDPNEKKPVQNAVIALLTPKDSILFKFTRTDINGKYTIKNVKPGDYILMTTHPYFADLLDNISIQNDLQIPEIALISKAKLLQEVIIKTGSPIKIRGDTTVYTADSFKVSANANVEELLKKLPGIQVDKDGKIKAMGETVKKVLVDGEEFFGEVGISPFLLFPGVTFENSPGPLAQALYGDDFSREAATPPDDACRFEGSGERARVEAVEGHAGEGQARHSGLLSALVGEGELHLALPDALRVGR